MLRNLADDWVDYLAHLGLYGALISGVQCVLLAATCRRSAAASPPPPSCSASTSVEDFFCEKWPWETASASWGLFGFEAGFVASLVTFYIGVASLLEMGSTATTSAHGLASDCIVDGPCMRSPAGRMGHGRAS